MNYKDKHALVLGLGESGLAMTRWLAHCGATVRVADTRESPDRLSILRESASGIEFVSGEFLPPLLDGIDFVAVSPGLMPTVELAAILPAAKEKNIPVWSEIELFAQALASLKAERGYTPSLIAITGTNGKTTVTSLTGLLCQRAGLQVQVAGNISPAALDVLHDALDQDALPQVWVLELSSFQLHYTFSLNADAATVLNLSQDHLDWHGGMDAYAADKAHIFGKKNRARSQSRRCTCYADVFWFYTDCNVWIGCADAGERLWLARRARDALADSGAIRGCSTNVTAKKRRRGHPSYLATLDAS